MSYQPQFNGWETLTLADLLVAYRKVKADCFFENCFPTAINFAEYEQDLLGKLKSLLKRLQENKGFGKLDDLLGPCRLLPKKLGIKVKEGVQNSHTHFSDPDRAFEYLHHTNHLIPEFRIVGDFPVETHIISALWINMIGHKFDACLDDKLVFGARLKRVRNDDELDKKAPKLFHITAVGSFTPYFKNYQQWRNGGLKAIRSELEHDRPIIAVSLDLKSYYHLLDPSFIATEEFQKEIGLEGKFNEQERDFTNQLAQLLFKWSNKAALFAQTLQGKKKTSVNGGLTIGLTASRIISNVLLQKWDRLIREKLTPIHYGRYVDDMFLVLHDPGSNVIKDALTFMDFLQKRLGSDVLTDGKGKDKDIWTINLGSSYQGKSKIQLQANKQKLFILDGQAGCDLLDSIEKEIRDLSSEYRLMPAPDQLEHTTAARVLSAAGNIGEEADTLRRADGLTIRRLSWSIQLRHVETLAHDLPAHEWKKQRDEFYAFAHNHVLRADKIFAQYQYLPRLLGFAIGLKDWRQAEAIVRKSLDAFVLLSKHAETKMVINGVECVADPDIIWRYAKGSLTWAFIDAVARCYPVDLLNEDNPGNKVRRLAKVFMSQLLAELVTIEDLFESKFDSEDFHKKAPLLAWTDLAKTPYKKLLKDLLSNNSNAYSSECIRRELQIAHVFQDSELLSWIDLKSFLKASRYARLNENKKLKNKFEPITPFLLPTRPYSPEEISGLIPECIGFGKAPLQLWARYVRALRGVWINPALLNGEAELEKEKLTDELKRPSVTVGVGKSKKIRIAITNLATADTCWAASACDKPELSLERYTKLSDLVNQAIKLKPKPDYLILPELSLPLRWVNSISNRLQGSGISLIAGTEYRHAETKTIFSQACLTLTDARLGYPCSLRIWQPKLEPAVGEDKELISKFGKSWKKFSDKEKQKPVYSHNGFSFGVMICSELQNSKARIAFQGEVDALLVLAWNKDLDTFSALVESAALDIHAYTVLVNNRNYGDSRVRAPSKESFERDLARLRGGKNDFCVMVELDIEKLRAFQSRAKRWTENGDPFKPTPEGFKISKARRYLPPK